MFKSEQGIKGTKRKTERSCPNSTQLCEPLASLGQGIIPGSCTFRHSSHCSRMSISIFTFLVTLLSPA